MRCCPMVAPSGDDPKTISVRASGIEEPTESSGWILSGFDSEGMAVRLNINEIDLRADPDGLIVGRSTRKAKLILKDDSVSRAHARIALDGGLALEDLESSNGTRVNGRMLEVGELAPIEQGASIEIGAVRLTLTRS